MTDEIVEWRPVRDWPNYEVSSDGQLRNATTGRVLKLTQHGRVLRARLKGDGKSAQLAVDGLVAAAYLPEPLGPAVVRHIDGDKLNSRADNLDWHQTEERRLDYVGFDDGGFNPVPTKHRSGSVPELKPIQLMRVLLNAQRDTVTNCWVWAGNKDAHGYGIAAVGGHKYRAHRLTYGAMFGDPGNNPIDHVCRNRACVNPNHLERVTHQQNQRRGVGVAAINARKTHCDSGHEFTPENTYVRRIGGRVGRDCRTCHREQERRRVSRKRAA